MNRKRFGAIVAILLLVALAGCAQPQLRHDSAPATAWPDQSYPTD